MLSCTTEEYLSLQGTLKHVDTQQTSMARQLEDAKSRQKRIAIQVIARLQQQFLVKIYRQWTEQVKKQIRIGRSLLKCSEKRHQQDILHTFVEWQKRIKTKPRSHTLMARAMIRMTQHSLAVAFALWAPEDISAEVDESTS